MLTIRVLKIHGIILVLLEGFEPPPTHIREGFYH